MRAAFEAWRAVQQHIAGLPPDGCRSARGVAALESRNDWFDVLLRGLPPEEEEHVLQVIAESDAQKAQHIERQNRVEVARLARRRGGRRIEAHSDDGAAPS